MIERLFRDETAVEESESSASATRCMLWRGEPISARKKGTDLRIDLKENGSRTTTAKEKTILLLEITVGVVG